MLDDDQRNYLESIGITQKQLTALEDDKLDIVSDINTLIKALFACNKSTIAWDLIKENLEIIDFRDVMNTPYTEIDRTATDVFKYMYDKNIIDEKSYMYHEALSGKLNNWELWKHKFTGLTTTQKLELLHNSFNDIFVQAKINPYELGLIHLTEDQFDSIFSNIEKDEKIDFIFEDKPCIDMDAYKIQELLLNNHLDPEKCIKYFNIIFEVYTHSYSIDDEKYREFYYEFFNTIKLYVKNIDSEIQNTSTLKILYSLNIDTLQKMYIIIDWIRDNLSKEYNHIAERKFILTFIINCPLTLSNTFTIFKYASINAPIELHNYLNNDKNLEFTISYSLHPLVDTSNYIIKYLFPGGCPMVYNKNSNMIMIGNDIKPYAEDDLAFIDDYLIAETVNDELFKNFNSIDEYKEFILCASDFRDKINNFLG